MITDEVHFHSNGFVNKHTFRYWGKEYPKILDEKELHPQRVTVRCTIMCDGIIGLYFIENAEGFTETVNGERYRHMFNTFLRHVVTHLRNRHELWFKQDGATCHAVNETIMCAGNVR